MLKIFGLEYAACIFVYMLINFCPLISVLYAQELISFICIAGSFQVGETNAIASVHQRDSRCAMWL
jgi:hypothetical protein